MSVVPLDLNQIAALLARQRGFKGLIVIGVDYDDVEYGVYGLSYDECERALCLTLYGNTDQGLEAAVSSVPEEPGPA